MSITLLLFLVVGLGLIGWLVARAKAQAMLYEGLGHSDIVMALARPFRDKAPVVEDMDAFFAKVR